MSVGIIFVCVVVCSLHITYAEVSKRNQFVYPGPIKDIDISKYLTVNKPDSCDGLTYCSVKPNDYPQERFNKMYEGKILEPMFQPIALQVDDRQGDPAMINNCETNVTFGPLYTVLSQSGEWRTVIQAPEKNFLQAARLETCKEADTPCFLKYKSPPNLRATCRQQYNTMEFLVDDNKGGTEKIHADLPICCSCHYKTKD
ncbi:unnamed protein product [Arctia plantaginis]|uniref:Spaetzle domain-containing protein n=1 Tax=Arctia plantaginis TaxID=874455 RepID=A0A8S0Z2P6_ARCPL|nr:unnamed protein product [Arctia plantaginis]